MEATGWGRGLVGLVIEKAMDLVVVVAWKNRQKTCQNEGRGESCPFFEVLDEDTNNFFCQKWVNVWPK